METGITPVMEMGHDTGFGSGGMWIFALLILLLIGNGGGLFGGNASRAATIEDLNNTSNFSRLESQVMNNGNLVETKMDGLTKGICDLGYTQAQLINGVSREVLESRYLNEKTITDSTTAVSAQIQALSNKIDANKIEALTAKVNELQLQQAMYGVVRYPNGYVYTAGNSPFCNCGCGCNI